MRLWATFFGYELVWFAAVIGAGHGHFWPGLCAAMLFTMWQISTSHQRALDLRLTGAALALGAVLDGGAAAGGCIHYAAAAPALPPGGAPLWILALWVAFAPTMTRTMAWLKGRPWLGMSLGAVGAPLAYASAAHWHALTFEPPKWHAILWLAGGWAAAVPLLAYLSVRRSRAPRDRTSLDAAIRR
ncbi:MAG: DUF2878 domain-containing protein [Steroidobacteraceae bacterium]